MHFKYNLLIVFEIEEFNFILCCRNKCILRRLHHYYSFFFFSFFFFLNPTYLAYTTIVPTNSATLSIKCKASLEFERQSG